MIGASGAKVASGWKSALGGCGETAVGSPGLSALPLRKVRFSAERDVTKMSPLCVRCSWKCRRERKRVTGACGGGAHEEASGSRPTVKYSCSSCTGGPCAELCGVSVAQQALELAM
eukprot:5402655-Prymnesium_polylepis.1